MTGCTGFNNQVELLMILPNVSEEVCIAINKKLGIDNPADVPPQDVGGAYDITAHHFNGTFTAINRIDSTETDGKLAGCFEGGGSPAAGTYHFYQVLLER